jgi:hypothetical protein
LLPLEFLAFTQMDISGNLSKLTYRSPEIPFFWTSFISGMLIDIFGIEVLILILIYLDGENSILKIFQFRGYYLPTDKSNYVGHEVIIHSHEVLVDLD